MRGLVARACGFTFGAFVLPDPWQRGAFAAAAVLCVCVFIDKVTQR